MSAFRPQTTKTGNLPHLSFIQRKPEPLGTELKVAMCTELQVMTFLSLCRGKNDETSTDVKNYESVDLAPLLGNIFACKFRYAIV